jgi:FkbM family methyltransferase
MDRPVALYGAGSLGRLARDFLTGVGRDFAMAIDRNADELARDPYWSGVALRHPDAVPQITQHLFRLAVSIVTSPYVPIEQSLIEQGFDDVVPFYDLAESFRAEHPLSNGWFAAPLTSDDQLNTVDVLARWHDDESRAHHLQFLAWRRLREEWTFERAPVVPDNRFFIPEVTSALHDNEFFVDGGAHYGFVATAFIERTRNVFDEIAVIEPDAGNRAILTDNLAVWLARDSRVTVYDCALSDSEGSALFRDGLGYASQITPLGETSVTLCSLDALKLSPTFIKLHLEGAELDALKGGCRTLRSRRPMIAATVYHNADGIWKTPLWLMENLQKYRFYFRSHGWCGTGAVVYAIPEERYAA